MAVTPESGPREWSPRWNYLAIYVNAGHTPSGNPKRGYYIVDNNTGDPVDFVEEGYSGKAVLTKAYPEIGITPRIEITNREYRELVQWGKNQAERHKRGEI